MKQLLYRGIIWRGLNYLTLFLVTIAIARLFKAGDSGVINYLINNLALLILVTSFSLESATGYYSAKEEIEQPAIIGVSLLMALGSLVACAILIGLIFPVTGWMLLSASFYCCGVVLINYFTGLFYSHYQFRFPNTVLMIVNATIILLIIAFPSYLLREDGEAFLHLYFGSFLLTGLILAASYFNAHGRQVKIPSLTDVKKLFRYATIAMFSNLIFFLVYRVDYWFVKTNCTDEELGNYIQVSKLGHMLMLLPAILAGMVFTRTVKTTSDDPFAMLQILSRLLFTGYCLILIIPAFFGFWLFPLVYGESFQLMYLPFVLLIPGILSLATLSLLTAYNAGQGKVMVNLRGGLVALVVIILGNLVFSARFGIYAAAAISSLGYIAYHIYVLLIIKRSDSTLRISSFFLMRTADFGILKNVFVPNEKN